MLNWRMVSKPLVDSDLLVGIDDTDNLESPGTGFLAQQLIGELRAAGLARACGATRHQLLKDPRVPFTSHNSSACLALQLVGAASADDVRSLAAEFLSTQSAPGSDPGLAVVRRDVGDDAAAALIEWGRATKVDLQTQAGAYEAARLGGAQLSGHGGTEDGVIGALAAVGLHLSGHDGFFIWMDGIRSVRPGLFEAGAVFASMPLADARTAGGRRPDPEDDLRVDPWIRPLLRDGGAVLLLEYDGGRWATAPRRVVKDLP